MPYTTVDGTLVHINMGVGRKYRAYRKVVGGRIWRACGPNRKKRDTAAKDMLRGFMEKAPTGDQYKRANVCILDDYCDPQPIMELKR